MKTEISDVLRSVRFTFFPRRCVFCGRVVEPTAATCGKCRNDVLRVQAPICFACGCSRRHCVCKRTHNRFVTAFAAPFYYLGYTRDAIRRMKFRKEPELAQTLGSEMAEFSRQIYENVAFDLVTFVPMTERELHERGFNQSELLARETAQQLSLPCRPTLCKLYETARQHSLSKRLRTGNVMGVFDVSCPETVRDRRILLCDDLRTTGATLTECAKMLCLYGAREVFCLTAAVGFPTMQPQSTRKG